jgi:acetolactate synthase-1/2/3 large subunit
MNVQELATAKIEKINAKCLLLNNQHFGHGCSMGGSFLRVCSWDTPSCAIRENIGGPENLDANLSRLHKDV